jgi:hypothetical protein
MITRTKEMVSPDDNALSCDHSSSCADPARRVRFVSLAHCRAVGEYANCSAPNHNARRAADRDDRDESHASDRGACHRFEHGCAAARSASDVNCERYVVCQRNRGYLHWAYAIPIDAPLHSSYNLCHSQALWLST